MSDFDPLVQEIAWLLEEKKWRLTTAESCTGGLVSSILTELPGSSSWFERAFVTYSNQAKEDMLSVPKNLLEKHGAVSEVVAASMALGALAHSQSHIAVAITGIAGPAGGSVEKPVGTVCFGWALRDKDPAITVRKLFGGTRQEIRMAACYEALSGVFALLKDIPLNLH